MRYAMVLLVVLVVLAVSQSYTFRKKTSNRAALAPVLGRKYKLYSSKNLDAVLKLFGVKWFLRKLIKLSKPVIEFTETNGEYKLKAKGMTKEIKVRFTINQVFTQKTPDGEEWWSLITQQRNVLTQVEKGKKSKQTITIKWTLTRDQIKMVITVCDAIATLIYKPLR